MIVLSTGCPASIGPEISVRAAADFIDASPAPPPPVVLVGDERTLLDAAALVGVPRGRFRSFEGAARSGELTILQAGPRLAAKDRRPGKPTAGSGAAQLAYINEAFALVKGRPRSALATAAVSKAVIQSSGAKGAQRFLGHTEWLRDLDRADHTTMCFTTPSWITALVTTHLSLRRVPSALTARAILHTIVDIAELARALAMLRPRIAICSLNPHAGESELLGKEEGGQIVPAIHQAKRRVGRGVLLVGPIGAETAYRKAQAGEYEAVVAMYHDQATIPTKLVAFGRAVNVTMGLSIVRTSVDHGTAYDIAWHGLASSEGMQTALQMADKLRRRWRRAPR